VSTALLMMINTLLPLLALWWLVAPQRAGRLEWLAKALMILAYLFCVAFASVWLVPSVYAPYAYFALYVIAIGLSWITARARPWPLATGGAKLRFGLHLAFAAVFAAIGAYGWAGRAAPEGETIALEFPLRDGRFYVASGGTNRAVNYHYDAPARYRGQSLGLDIVAFDRLGQRAAGLKPADPAAYTVFGLPVYAPCDGTVKRAVDGLPDQSPPDTDHAHLAGNHVIVACGNAEIVLAHLREGSIEVREGDAVRRGQRLAAVGNSGQTTEPHLHIHAQRAGAGDPLLDREPLGMTFGGRSYARGIVRPEVR
jgi:hypothetical protein